MKFLLDMPVSPSLIDVLHTRGHEALHADRIGLRRASDSEILAVARETESIVVTADLDFPRLLALSAAAGPGLILFRGGNYSDAEMRELLESVLDRVRESDLIRSVCVVDRSRVRVTALPLGGEP